MTDILLKSTREYELKKTSSKEEDPWFPWVFKSFQGFFYEFDWSSWYVVIKKSNFINRLY